MDNGRESRVWWLLTASGVLAVALAIRLPALDQRPMHGDEANQAVRAGRLFETGVYHYDPTDHHGPVLYYAALPFCLATAKTFAETTEWDFRLVPVVFSCLTLLLTLGLGIKRDGGLFANREGLVAAVVLTAVSPAMVYYSRFFIQESMLVTFLTGMLVCAVRYVRVCGARGPTSGTPADKRSTSRSGREVREGECPHEPRRTAAWSAAGFGAFAGLAAATKETVVLSFAAAALAAVAACGFRRLFKAWNTRHAMLAAGAATLVALLFYSSFLTYPKGVYDALFSTLSACFTRATAVPEHQHPWNYYLEILCWFKYGRGPVWSEAGLLIPAFVAAVVAFRKTDEASPTRDRTQTLWVRFVAVYTVTLLALYSAVPYKTPWCVLSFLYGFILLAGLGVGDLIERARRTGGTRRLLGAWLVRVLVLLLVARQVSQAYRACYKQPADPRNPYVYAHTGADAMNLVATVEKAAQKAQGFGTLIAVAVPTPDTWPLPWYLRKYAQVGYWTRVEDIPEALAPEIVIAAADQGDAADARFGRGKHASFFGIRPGVLLNVFVPVADTGEKRR